MSRPHCITRRLSVGPQACVRRTKAAVLIGLVLTIASGVARAQEAVVSGIPAPYRASYEAGGGLGRVDVSLRRTEQGLRFEYRSSVAFLGLRKSYYECSLMRATAGSFEPIEFLHRDLSGGGRRDEHIVFNRQDRTITLRHGQRTRVEPFGGGMVWDALSVQLQMAADVANGRSTMSYQIAERGSIHTRVFGVTPGGNRTVAGQILPSVIVERQGSSSADFTTRMAPLPGYVPIEFTYRRKLHSLNIQLRSFESGITDTVPARCEPGA